VEGRLNACIAVVISNVAGVYALERAQTAGISTVVIDHRGWPSRDDFDRALVAELQAQDVSLVCLAGFMRRLGQPLLQAFPDAVLNIHPSLLPSFSGLHPQRQALDHGAKLSGVTEQLDAGPILLQRSVPVLDDDTEDSLAARILAEEHVAYPAAVQMMIDGAWRIDGRRFLRS
jgi:phosphoribosylglycinamide formyltransferase-1